MGCGGSNSAEIRINEINQNSFKDLGFNLKESLVLFFSKNTSLNNINIGLYSDIIYSKKKGLEKIIKYKKEKFFIQNNKKKGINNSILKKYYELYPKYINYSSVGMDEQFSPNFLLNNNFEKIFETLGIKQDKNKINKFVICSINNKKPNNNVDELNKMKNKYKNSFYIYENTNINDEVYIPYENWAIFFNRNNVDFWIENKYITNENFDIYMNFKENSINTNNEIIENYIKDNNEKEKVYKIKYKYYEIFDKDGTLISSKTFPLIIISQQQENEDKNYINIYLEKKPNFKDYILNLFNTNFAQETIKISKIEIFKERIASFLLKTYFIFKKRYSIYLSRISSENLFTLIKFIEKNININEEYIHQNNLIENLIVMPEINTKFKLFEQDKFIYIIMNNSTCFNFAKSVLKKIYKDIYGNMFIKFICIYKSSNAYIGSESSVNNNEMFLMKSNEEILYISDYNLVNEEKKNLYELYIHSFSDINYFSHILLITNSEGIITYTNYFNNRAQIFQNILKKDGINIKRGLELINTENFKEVKNYYFQKCKLLLNSIENIYNENLILFNNESLFENFYKKFIFHQPYLSLKYNKIIPLNPEPNNKFYKNYSLNYMNIENILDINFDSKEHQSLNEISYIFNEKDSYIEFKKDLRCKNCFSKINNNEGIEKNKYIFYICPISKDIICQKCYRYNKKYEESYPFNLLYVKCKDQTIFNNLPKDNCFLFKDRINYDEHLEIIDEKCDICNNYLCLSENKKETIYILLRIIKKNYFLICNKCFEILISDDKEWIFDDKYDYMKTFIVNFFIDLDNLIFKMVKFK